MGEIRVKSGARCPARHQVLNTQTCAWLKYICAPLLRGRTVVRGCGNNWQHVRPLLPVDGMLDMGSAVCDFWCRGAQILGDRVWLVNCSLMSPLAFLAVKALARGSLLVGHRVCEAVAPVLRRPSAGCHFSWLAAGCMSACTKT